MDHVSRDEWLRDRDEAYTLKRLYACDRCFETITGDYYWWIDKGFTWGHDCLCEECKDAFLDEKRVEIEDGETIMCDKCFCDMSNDESYWYIGHNCLCENCKDDAMEDAKKTNIVD